MAVERRGNRGGIHCRGVAEKWHFFFDGIYRSLSAFFDLVDVDVDGDDDSGGGDRVNDDG